MLHRSLAVLLTLAAGLGCGSTTLPRPAPQSEHCGPSTVLPYAIRVLPAQYPAYTDDLIEALERAVLFVEVLGPEDPGDAELEARVDRLIYGTATFPLLTMITLGVVPTIVSEEYGHAFSITSASASPRSVSIDTSYEGKTWLGWLAGVRAMHPRVGLGNPEKSTVYVLNLRAAICRHRPILEELAAPAE